MATSSIDIDTIERALRAGFAKKDRRLGVFFFKSDYKDFIRMYVISDYFQGMSEKERLGEIFSVLKSHGANAQIQKISLCIPVTNEEYEADFGGDDWIVDLSESSQRTKPRPRSPHLAKAHNRN